MGVRFSRGVFIATYLNGREPGSDPGSGSSTLPVAVLGFGVKEAREPLKLHVSDRYRQSQLCRLRLMAVIPGSQPGDTDSSSVGGMCHSTQSAKGVASKANRSETASGIDTYLWRYMEHVRVVRKAP